MSKTFLLFIVLLACACSNQTDQKATEETTTDTSASTGAPTQPAPDTSTANAGAAASDKEKAIELIGKSDCLTCHTIDEKKIGPPYREVANKYVADEQTKNLLAEKIIKGGSGVWGQVPMTPHPTISQEDAKVMVSYILSLKQK